MVRLSLADRISYGDVSGDDHAFRAMAIAKTGLIVTKDAARCSTSWVFHSRQANAFIETFNGRLQEEFLRP